MKYAFVMAVLLALMSGARADPVDDQLKVFTQDGCLSMDEIMVLESMPPTVSDGVRELSAEEIRKFNAVMGKDMTKGGTLKLYISFFQGYGQVRIFAMDDKGCYATGGFLRHSSAMMFLERGI